MFSLLRCLFLYFPIGQRELHRLKEAVIVEEAEEDMIAKNYIDCDAETIKANLALVEWLEALDDVDAVYHNMNLPE